MNQAITIEHFRGLLAEEWSAARQRRAEAFVRYSPVIAGQRCEPITLPRYNQLVAFRSPFVCGGPVGLEDVFVLLWVLHPAFAQFDSPGRLDCYRAAARALSPRRPVLSAFARLVCPFSPRLRWLLARFIEPTSDELLEAAVAEARRLVAEAISEFPGSGRREAVNGAAPEEPLPFAFQAQVLNLLRRELGLSFAEAERMPLKELCQHIRECVHTATKGRANLQSPAEARIWEDYEKWIEEKSAPTS